MIDFTKSTHITDAADELETPEEPPVWALIRAHDLLYPRDAGWSRNSKVEFAQGDALCDRVAHYIMQHEKPPTDPLLIEAREIAAAAGFVIHSADWAEQCVAGDWDDHGLVEVALSGIKRGIEIGGDA